MKKAIIIGASSGIGKELAKLFAHDGYILGLAARRINLLEDLKNELNCETYLKRMDVSKPEEAVTTLLEMIEAMGGLDLLVICSGTGEINSGLIWEYEKDTIDVNVSGFTALSDAAMRYFLKKGSGHIAAISSIAALRGSGISPAYNASKAYMSNYLEGLSIIAYGKDIAVTDIKPGLVRTAMAKGDKQFWVAPADKAAKQIYNIISRRKPVGYVTKRWSFVAFFFKAVPRSLYIRMCGRN